MTLHLRPEEAAEGAAPPSAGLPPDDHVLAVEGMTCGACAARIERRLNKLPGVSARVNYATERASLRIEAGRPVSRVLDEVAALGYAAHPLAPDDPPDTDNDERVRALRRRLIVAVVLFMPLCDVSLAFWLLPGIRFPGWQAAALLLAAPVVAWAASPFYRAAARAARHGTTTMDTLVSIGILASTAWSVYAMFWQDLGGQTHSLLWVLGHGSAGGIYLDIGAGVTTFLLGGRYFEARARQQAGDALRSLAALAARDVAILDADGTEVRRPTSWLAVGDRFVVQPGESIATDGRVLQGAAAVDRSAMTGESVPEDVEPGVEVTGGTVSLNGRLVVEATRVGGDTQLAQMLRMVEEAQNQKASAQRLADRVSSVFVPAVLLISAVTLVAWLQTGHDAGRSIDVALSVLIIACPCALGLATPAALVVASGEGARNGIFFKGYQALERTRHVDTVLLDKTGTLTEGRMRVVGVAPAAGGDPATTLSLAAAVERHSSHPIAEAIVAAAETPPEEAVDVETLAGLGVRGSVGGRRVTVGRAGLVDAGAGSEPPPNDEQRDWDERGYTTVVVGADHAVVGHIAVADTLRASAADAVDRLGALGLRCVLVSGDAPAAVGEVARALGITETVAGALPGDKVDAVRRLQGEGHVVAVVGDGINDGPALAAADLGLAVGTGTEVALNAADLIILRDDLGVIADGVDLARRTLRAIRGNLVWAFGYNVVAIPVAAAGFLNPLIAGAAMTLSSVFVVANSFRIRRAPAGAPVLDWHDEDFDLGDDDLAVAAVTPDRPGEAARRP